MPKIVKNTAAATEETDVQSNPEVSGDVQEGGAEGGGAETSSSDDLFLATFTVHAVTNDDTKARETLGEDGVEVLVTRTRKDAYQASFNGVEGRAGVKTARTAVNRALEAAGFNPAEFTFDAPKDEGEQAPIPEMSGDNSDIAVPFYQDEFSESGKRLHDVEPDLVNANDLLGRSKKDARAGYILVGRSINTITAIFAENGYAVDGEGEAGKRGNKALGEYLESVLGDLEFVKEFFTSKNDRKRCANFALAPEALLETMPDINTPGSFEKKLNSLVNSFAKEVAQAHFEAVRDNAEVADKSVFSVDDQRVACLARHAKQVETFEKDRAAYQAAVMAATEKGKDAKDVKNPLGDRKQFNLAIGWQLGDGDGYNGSKLAKAVDEAWTAKKSEPTEAQRVETVVKQATAAIAKAFKDKSVEDAAKQMLVLLMSHGSPAAVLDTLVEMQADAVAKQLAQREAELEAAKAAQSAA